MGSEMCIRDSLQSFNNRFTLLNLTRHELYNDLSVSLARKLDSFEVLGLDVGPVGDDAVVDDVKPP